MEFSNLQAVEAFTTKDGSEIRELAGPGRPDSAAAVNQSLAEATLPPGGATSAHFHRLTEELYFVTAGTGRLRVGEEEREVAPGDCVTIPAGMEHKLWNTGEVPMKLLCCCAPAYSHDDTVLTEPGAA